MKKAVRELMETTQRVGEKMPASRKRKRGTAVSDPSLSEEPSASEQLSDSGAPSVLSMKSARSMFQPLDFGSKSESTPPSGLPVKSDGSMLPPHIVQPSTQSIMSLAASDTSMDKVISFHSEMPQSRLTPEPSSSSTYEEHLRDPPHAAFLHAMKNLKTAMRQKFALVSEGNGDKGKSLNTIYTELIITTGDSEGPHGEHVFRNIRPAMERQFSKQSVNLSDIFKPLSDQGKSHRTVLTKGVAGIGKSFSVQKFVLDWAEGKANQDIDLLFCLSFRDVNLSQGKKSLYKLLTEFHPKLEGLNMSEGRVMVILDGLDESRLQLDFKNNKVVSSVGEETSVGNLLANLIQGNLLPDAKLWITSRPAAASQIPARFVDLVTEIRGFSDPQIEEYFKLRFSHDSGLADRVISHIRSSHCLNIMCQIPIFCWISAILFQETFGGEEMADIPQTLTEMMAHFLFAQTKRRSRKYDKMTETNRERLMKKHREFLLKLGKLAFVQLQNNNLIFYDDDFKDCSVDINEATIYSGFCTGVLREEEIFSQKKVFFFVHLTIQEFFAALFVYNCFTNKNLKEIKDFLCLRDEERSLHDLLKMTVDKVLEKKNGHLDFFLRFLLGLMVESNRRVLHGLLTSPDPSQEADKKILTHIKALRRKSLSPDSSISLFQTMVEMRDHKVKDDIQEFLKLSDHSKTELNPLQCSALAYMLQVSKNDLDELDLKSYKTSEEGRRRLIPAVRISKKAILADCHVTEEWVEHLAFGLKFPYLPLKDLDLSNNDLGDSGVKLLCSGLASQCCRLKILSLSGCLVTGEGCVHLASALKSNPSHLKELDLSYNNPGDPGKAALMELSSDSQCRFKVNVDHGGTERMKPGLKKYACKLTWDASTAHKNLHISEGKVAWVKEEQPYHHDKERFDLCLQVLCEQGLDGRCYWELEVVEPFSVGLTYRSIVRKGHANDCKLGHNDKSWCLSCSSTGCYVWNGNKRNQVPSLCWRSSRVALYLDWPAGILSFYRVSSDSRWHLYTCRAKFTEPLFPAVELHPFSSAILCRVT